MIEGKHLNIPLSAAKVDDNRHVWAKHRMWAEHERIYVCRTCGVWSPVRASGGGCPGKLGEWSIVDTLEALAAELEP